MILSISICTFDDGTFDVIFRNKKTGEELTFSGAQKLSPKKFDFANQIAPACVWTDYQKLTPD